MRNAILPIVFALFLLIGCSSQKEKINNTASLKSILVTIDPTKGSTFKTKHGAVINIPKDALQVNGKAFVQLEIKEAYDIADMVKGGLVTQSNGKPLSSGGMIYINPVGNEDVKIVKPISVAIPTPSLDKKMQLYKGEAGGDGTINWKDPQALGENQQLDALAKGRALFMNNCASCHGIDKDITGPSLSHILKRSSWMLNYTSGAEGDTVNKHNLLYEFTRNSSSPFISWQPYFTCLINRYHKTPMNTFPNLTDEDLNNLYAYIENESEIRNLPIPNNGILDCIDSCRLYAETKNRLAEIKGRLEKDSSDMLDLTYSFPQIAPDTTELIEFDTIQIPILDKVEPVENKSLYYQFKIETFGWYNVDQMIAGVDGVVDSKLSVRVNEQYGNRYNVFLAIPSVKLFAEGGLLKGENSNYGFYTKDGMIPLPQNTKAYILAIGEYEDKIIFAKKEFYTSTNQQLDLAPLEVTKEYFDDQIKSLSLADVNIRASEAKNAQELRDVIRKIQKAEELKPKNCDCHCFLQTQPAPGAEGMDYSPK